MSKLKPKPKLRATSEDMVEVVCSIPEEIIKLISPNGYTPQETIRAVIGGIAESCGVDLRYYPSLQVEPSNLNYKYVDTSLLEVCYESVDLPCAPSVGIEQTDPYNVERTIRSSALYDMESYSPRPGRTNPLGSTLSRLHSKQRELASAIARMRKLRRYDSVYAESGRPTREDALAELEQVCSLLPPAVSYTHLRAHETDS